MIPQDQLYLVKPVYKAMQVLIVLGSERRPLTLTEVFHRVRLPKTTVFRYLQTLVYCGFVSHNHEQDVYQLGPRLFELGQLAGQQLRIRDVAMPYMQALREQFNETINLAILDGEDVVYVDMVESGHTLRMQATVGTRDPAYCTALGRAMLAYMDAETLVRHIPQELAPRTAFTLHSRQDLDQALGLVRARGYALDDQENEDGARCVGAPIFEYPGRVAAAVSISAPTARLRPEMVETVGDAVSACAAAISRQLGYSGEPLQPDAPVAGAGPSPADR